MGHSRAKDLDIQSTRIASFLLWPSFYSQNGGRGGQKFICRVLCQPNSIYFSGSGILLQQFSDEHTRIFLCLYGFVSVFQISEEWSDFQLGLVLPFLLDGWTPKNLVSTFLYSHPNHLWTRILQDSYTDHEVLPK